MVQGDGVARGELLAQPLGLLDGGDVHDPRPVGPAEDALQGGVLFRLVDGGEHLEEQVGAHQVGDELEGVAHAELVRQVLPHLGGGGGGDGQDGRAPQPLGDGAEHHVVGAEVVPPLRHAVRLVHHEERHLPLEQELEEVAVAEALGGDVEDLPLAALDGLLGGGLLALGEAGVDGEGVHAQLLQLVRLVLHQRDQRRHHQGEPGEVERGELVDQRLPGAGGHHRHGVAPVEDGADHLLLSGPELLQPEVRAKRLTKRLPGRFGSGNCQ